MGRYDNYFHAGTKEPHRLIFVLNNPKRISEANDWHEHFGWKCKKVTPRGYGPGSARPDSDDKIMEWHCPDFSSYPGLKSFFLGSIGADYHTDEKLPFAVILYERSESMPYYNELGELQEAIETKLAKLSSVRYTIEDTSTKFLSVFMTSKRKEIETAKAELPRLIDEINALFDRLHKIRNENKH